jgi:hypothetical protein
MLNVISINAEQIRSPQAAPDETVVNNVFKVMHGCYGNLFLSKFASGVTDTSGRDLGVASARKVWAHSLRGFDEGIVLKALEQCQGRHPEYPPSLPQFVALCAAARPREVFRSTNQIGMSDQLRSQYARQARAIIAKHEEKARKRDAGFVPSAPGLDGLKQALANAVGLAGGDEVATLLRLDRMLAPRAAA